MQLYFGETGLTVPEKCDFSCGVGTPPRCWERTGIGHAERLLTCFDKAFVLIEKHPPCKKPQRRKASLRQAGRCTLGSRAQQWWPGVAIRLYRRRRAGHAVPRREKT